MQEAYETCVPFLGQEDPLEEERATHSSVPSWTILWTEEPAELQSMESQRVGHDSSDLARMHVHIQHATGS